MKRVVEFPDRRTVAEEAAEWLIRLDADERPDAETIQDLCDWMQRSPAHRAELANLARLWDRLNVLTDLAVPLGRPARNEGDNSSVQSRPRLRTFTMRAAVTALVLLVCSFAALQFVSQGEQDASANRLYATAVGQQSSAVLPDGSEVALNTNTQIRVDYSEDFRRVYLLQGEALFTVAKDADRPFQVYAGNGRIQALGTAFSVYIDGERVNVTVAEGRVLLASIERPPEPVAGAQRSRSKGAPRKAISVEEDYLHPIGTVEAGQGATLRLAMPELPAGTPDLQIIKPLPPEELAQRLAWRDGVLMFAGDTLEDVVREVSRYTTVKIEVPDSEVRNMRVGGRLPVGETAAMLAALETNFNLKVTRVGRNKVVLAAADD